jgi:hypothetical protein
MNLIVYTFEFDDGLHKQLRIFEFPLKYFPKSYHF